MKQLHQITFPAGFAGWQNAARRALAAAWAPSDIFWQEWNSHQPSLDLAPEADWSGQRPAPNFRVPSPFLPLAERVSCHRDSGRWTLLYRVLWRLTHGENHLLQLSVDPDIHQLNRMDKAVRHEVHKMRAFVRFREVKHGGESWYVAWFEPGHDVVELNASFFTDRFANMNWSILTPDRCAHWNGKTLSFTEGVARSESPDSDEMEGLWQKYYSSIFNPARVKENAMLSEMPLRYWKNLPEAAIIPSLLREAPARSREMLAQSRHLAAEPVLEAMPLFGQQSLPALREAAACCKACPLYHHATQTVFGEGNPRARLVLVGEQPGDQEDKQGHPFVGPAGQLLNRALEEAGINRDEIYLTNAVKHFKWEPRGKVRLHKKASEREITICHAWLDAELKLIRPEIILCLGATAAQSVIGPEIRVQRDRGQWFQSSYSSQTLVTLHPSALLRLPDEKERKDQFLLFVREIKMAARALQGADAATTGT